MKADAEIQAVEAGQLSGQAPPAGDQEPLSPSEQYLASVWAEIIGLDAQQIRSPHKFVEIGGNSLTLNVILTKIEADTGVSLPAELFFDEEKSSLLALARELDALRAAKGAAAS